MVVMVVVLVDWAEWCCCYTHSVCTYQHIYLPLPTMFDKMIVVVFLTCCEYPVTVLWTSQFTPFCCV